MFAAIETSFDEAGIAVCGKDGQILSDLLSSQAELHAPYGGCVPELAARTHLSDLPQLWAKLPQQLAGQIEYAGVTSGPGLPGCLLAGVNFARGVSAGLEIPLYSLNHLSGHLFSPFIPGNGNHALTFPHLGLLISGGHTELYLVNSLTDITLLGQTLDDAVGELLDKVSALLGYGYPGGARLEQLARTYSGMSEDAVYEGEFSLPIPMLASGDLNFSYSGLKTAVVRLARPTPNSPVIGEESHPSLLACLFAAVADSLVVKVQAALEQTGVDMLTVSGGVAINGFIRKRFEAECSRMGILSCFPQPKYCLDNAAMMAWLLKLTVDSGCPAAPFDVDSNWNPGVRIG